ncbi:MAG: hypothetical protein JNM10_05645 [Planctomycetia bacterium]|nr:hypothetical protein [Planctomycetia bacterium]
MSDAPVLEISGRFPDAPRAAAAVEALNRWFRWIVDGAPPPAPPFVGFDVDPAEYALSLGDDLDWELGPHARAVGPDVRIAIHTSDTHLIVAGLLRRMGALAVKIVRDDA